MEDVVKVYGSNIINILVFPLIGAAVVFMGIIPFLIAEGLSVSGGSWIYAIVTILLGLLIITYPFTYKLLLKPTSIVHKRLWGEKEVSFMGTVQVGRVEQRVMNGTPIAINKAELIYENGQRQWISLRNIGLDQSKEIIAFIQSNAPNMG